jgi:hypothetical protein
MSAIPQRRFVTRSAGAMMLRATVPPDPLAAVFTVCYQTAGKEHPGARRKRFPA